MLSFKFLRQLGFFIFFYNIFFVPLIAEEQVNRGKILVVLDCIYFGTRDFILSQIRGLIERNYDIYIVSERKFNNIPSELKKYNLSKKNFYRNLPGHLRSFDVILCQFGPLGVQYNKLRNQGLISGKIVTCFRGMDASAILKNRSSFYYDLFQTGDLFLPVSNHFKIRLLDFGCPAGKVHVLYSGIDIDKFSCKWDKTNYMHKEKSVITIVTVARLDTKKGYEYGLRAIAMLIKKHPNLQYIIVGDGSLLDDLTRHVKTLGIQKNVHFMGKKSHDEIPKILKKSDIFLLPSITSYSGNEEGVPVSLMEAMSVGLPVVSTYHAGIPELIEHNKNGFLVQEKNIKALTDTLEFLVEHPEEWPTIGLQARMHIEKYHTMDTENNKLDNLISELIKK